MTTPDCAPYTQEIIDHFVRGTALNGEARQHYISCADCMVAVTAALSQKTAATVVQDHGTRGTKNSSSPSLNGMPEGARQALEHGRRVLAREFGIGANNHPGSPG